MIRKTASLGTISYFLSNPGAFFYRFGDTGFKNKWAGLWSHGIKFLEFFDFKAGEEFLGEQNCIEAQYDFLKATHLHRLKDGSLISQKTWLPRSGGALVLELSSKKEIAACLEIAVNMRSVHENLHSRQYKVKPGNRLAVESDLGKLFIAPLKGKSSFQSNPQYRVHAPGGEQQCYFVPGIFKLKGNKIAFSISTENFFRPEKNELLHKSKNFSKLASAIETDNEGLGCALNSAASAIELLHGNDSYIAGLPWFQQYWARDIFWSLPAITMLGQHENAKQSLSFFASHSAKGQVPNYIFGNEKTFNAIDSTPLFLIALEHYCRASGDRAFAERMAPQAVHCMEFLDSRRDPGDGFIVHDQGCNETWMDTLNRPKKAVEVQALYVASLKAFSQFASYLKRPERKIKEKADWAEKESADLEKKFDNEFFKGGFFIDRIAVEKKDSTRRVNALVPLFLGVSGRKEVLEAFRSEEFSNERGVLSLSRFDPKFSPDSYHEGKVWSLCNGLMGGAEFLLGDPENGWHYFDLLSADLERDALGCIGECWNPSTLQQTGCPNQLWGDAMALRLFNEFAMGLKVDAYDKTISLSPKLCGRVSFIEMRLSFGAKEGILKIRPKDNAASFSLPGYKIEYF
ncbi:MAG: amylo-alpha-1,6-glucosidase [Candidatus Diapherotrites archaeon]